MPSWVMMLELVSLFGNNRLSTVIFEKGKNRVKINTMMNILLGYRIGRVAQDCLQNYTNETVSVGGGYGD